MAQAFTTREEIIDHQLQASVAHMLSDGETVVDLLDEIMEAPEEDHIASFRKAVTCVALQTISTAGRESIHHQLALETLNVAFRQQATLRAVREMELQRAYSAGAA